MTRPTVFLSVYSFLRKLLNQRFCFFEAKPYLPIRPAVFLPVYSFLRKLLNQRFCFFEAKPYLSIRPAVFLPVYGLLHKPLNQSLIFIHKGGLLYFLFAIIAKCIYTNLCIAKLSHCYFQINDFISTLK